MDKNKLIKCKKNYLLSDWLLAVLSGFFVVFYAACLVAIPIFIGNAIDNIVGIENVNIALVLHSIGFIAIFTLFSAVFGYLGHIFAAKFACNVSKNMRVDAIKKTNEADICQVDQISIGKAAANLSQDGGRIESGIVGFFNQILGGIVQVVLTIFIMFFINIYLGLVVVLVTPLSVFVSVLISKKSHKLFKKQVADENELAKISGEFVKSLKTIRLYNYANSAGKKFDFYNQKIKKSGTRATFVSALVNPATRFINGLVYIGVCLVGAALILGGDGAITIGILAIFLSYAMQYARPFNEITGALTDMQLSLVSADRLLNLINLDKNLDKKNSLNKENLGLLPFKNGDVEFKNVSFGYLDNLVIKNFNLVIKKGKTIALAGKTGCGKTTLVNLLMRFFDVGSGQILIDGVDICNIQINDFWDNIGLVLQDDWVFCGSVLQNIMFSKPTADLNQAIEAAKKAQIHDFIMSLESGYDTQITPSSFSKGLNQLICLSRLFLDPKPIIILDEAASSVDAGTESKIRAAFNKLKENSTLIVVAHRLSTIKNCDMIVFIDGGEIVQIETHEDMVNVDVGWKRPTSD